MLSTSYSWGVLDTFHEAQRDRCVVDVLGGESEVYEFLVAWRNPHGIEPSLYVVFHCLDIMICGFFYLLDLCGFVFRHVLVDAAEGVEEAPVKAFELWQGKFAEGDEILYLNSYPVSYEGKFGIIRGQVAYLPVVSSVYWGNRCKHDCNVIKSQI